MERRIKFTKNGHSHLIGNFGPGDVFKGPEAVCSHFVNEAACAEWDEQTTAAGEQVAVTKAAKASSKKGAKV
jgi:hypothetical protein